MRKQQRRPGAWSDPAAVFCGERDWVLTSGSAWLIVVAMRARAGSVVLWSVASLLVMGLAGAGGMRQSRRPGRMDALPRVTVWAWERREDLRGIDVRTTAVGYLDRTVVVDGRGVAVAPRREGLVLPASDGLVRMAVVRVEASRDARLDGATAEGVARRILAAVDDGGGRVAALQVDFDARRSEREWYGEVLRRVRGRMQPGMPLSMTALASWCSYDGGWLRGLPVDEAVPMLFRMEPDRRRVMNPEAIGDFAIREPLCAGAVGVSTTERWPVDLDGKRVYVFADRGWARDGLEETVRRVR